MDARNELRSHTTCATLAHTFAYVGDKKTKGTVVSQIIGPIATFTRDANNIIDVTKRYKNPT